MSGIGRACAWVWRSLKACSRVLGAHVCLGMAEPGERVVGHQVRLCLGMAELEERVVGYRARVCLGMAPGACGVCSRVSGKRLPGYGRAYGVCSRYWLHVCLGMAEPGGRVVGYWARVFGSGGGARVLGGLAELEEHVVGYRARVCLGMAEPGGVLGYGGAWGACSRVSGARVPVYGAPSLWGVYSGIRRACAWVWLSPGTCSRV